MCGVVVSTVSREHAREMVRVIAHRGPDEHRYASFGGVHVGHARLSIVDIEAGVQPVEDDRAIVAFVGEVYNYAALTTGLPVSEAATLLEIAPDNREFSRYLDGKFAVVVVDKSRRTITLARDLFGVIPLYYQRAPFAVSSERKALARAIPVRAGETLTFGFDGRLRRRWRFDPFRLTRAPVDDDAIASLFAHAVRKRVLHSAAPVSVALSGGLDSALVLAEAVKHGNVREAVTVSLDGDSDEVASAVEVARAFGVEHRIVDITRDQIASMMPGIRWALEDPTENPVKLRGAIRNYFVAMHARARVILSGEGADEIACGYPSHVGRVGLALDKKSLSTVRSMPSINLDRVNLCGMAWGKEYRVPFLDHDFALALMNMQHDVGKPVLRRLAARLGVPRCAIDRSKYSIEEQSLESAGLDAWRSA
jgi:asparagine synthase (glutamine-hydrolysing)